MANLRMAEKVKSGEAIDLSEARRTEEGDYYVEQFVEDVDYCDLKAQKWIWSIGKDKRIPNRFIASTTNKFQCSVDYDLVWLR